MVTASINTHFKTFSIFLTHVSQWKCFTQRKPHFLLHQAFQNSNIAASTSTLKVNTGKNPLTFALPESEEGQSFIPKPPQEKEKNFIWRSQVLIPFSLSYKMLAFLGPYPSPKLHPKKVNELFPYFIPTMPSAFEQHALDLKFTDPFERVFRSSPHQITKNISLGSIKCKANKKSNGKT